MPRHTRRDRFCRISAKIPAFAAVWQQKSPTTPDCAALIQKRGWLSGNIWPELHYWQLFWGCLDKVQRTISAIK
jgi:hypothetical protein